MEEWISFVYYEEIKRDLNEHLKLLFIIRVKRLHVSVGVMKLKLSVLWKLFFFTSFFFP